MIANFVGKIFIGYDEGEIDDPVELPNECQIYDGDFPDWDANWDDEEDYGDAFSGLRIGVARNLEYIGEPGDTQYIRADVTVQEKYRNHTFEIYLTPTVGCAVYAYDDYN